MQKDAHEYAQLADQLLGRAPPPAGDGARPRTLALALALALTLTLTLTLALALALTLTLTQVPAAVAQHGRQPALLLPVSPG